MTLLAAIIGAAVVLFGIFKAGGAAKKSILFAEAPADVARWKDVILKASAQTGVPAKYITAVIWQESWGDPNAVGDGGTSWGLMQIKKGAAADVNRVYGVNVSDYAVNSAKNVLVGSYYLKLMRSQHSNWDEALEAYNQGATGRTRERTRPLAIAYREKIKDKMNQLA